MRLIIAIILVFLLQAVCLGQSAEDFDYRSDFTRLESPQTKLEDYLTPSESRYTTRYEGLQGIALSRGNSQFRRYQNRYLRSLWSSKNYNPCEWDRILQNYTDLTQEFQYGRWWDRSLFSSFPVEKGGVIVKEMIVGRELPLLRWRDITLTNTGKIRLGRVGFDVAQFSVPPPATLVSDPSSITKTRDPPFALRAIMPKGIFSGDSVKIATFQNIVLRASLKPEKILSRIEVGLTVRFYAGYPPKQWANLTIRGRSSPFEKYYEASFNFELLCF